MAVDVDGDVAVLAAYLGLVPLAHGLLMRGGGDDGLAVEVFLRRHAFHRHGAHERAEAVGRHLHLQAFRPHDVVVVEEHVDAAVGGVVHPAPLERKDEVGVLACGADVAHRLPADEQFAVVDIERVLVVAVAQRDDVCVGVAEEEGLLSGGGRRCQREGAEEDEQTDFLHG